MKKLFFLAVAVVILCVAYMFSSQSMEDEVVNVYSSRKEILMEGLFAEFTKETGIHVNVVVDKAPKLIARLRSEQTNTPADVFLTSDVGNLVKAKQEGLLQAIDSEVLNLNVPETLRDEEGYWYALSLRSRAIFYAKDRVSPTELEGYEDLSSKRWRGKLLIRSSSNIYNQSLLASLVAVHGQEYASSWVEGVVANFARKPQGGDTDQLRALAAGEGDVAVANSYYYGRLQASERPEDQEVASKIAIFFPNQVTRGAHMNVSGGGVVATAKHKENAIKLLVFLSSDKAQKFYADVNHEYPVRQDIERSEVVKAWGEVKMDEVHLRGLVPYLPDALKIADEKGWR